MSSTGRLDKCHIHKTNILLLHYCFTRFAEPIQNLLDYTAANPQSAVQDISENLFARSCSHLNYHLTSCLLPSLVEFDKRRVNMNKNQIAICKPKLQHTTKKIINHEHPNITILWTSALKIDPQNLIMIWVRTLLKYTWPQESKMSPSLEIIKCWITIASVVQNDLTDVSCQARTDQGGADSVMNFPSKSMCIVQVSTHTTCTKTQQQRKDRVERRATQNQATYLLNLQVQMHCCSCFSGHNPSKGISISAF